MERKMKVTVKFFLIVLVAGFLIFSSSFAQATNGMKVIGVGPVQRSMGGAGVALPLDASVTISNPAGIGLLDRRLDIGLTYFEPHVSYSAHSDAGMVTSNGRKIKSDAAASWIPAMGFVLHKNDTITLGLGAYGVSGMGVLYESNLYNNKTYTQYSLLKIAPALAWNVNEKLVLGFAPNIDYATMDFEAGDPSQVQHHGGVAWGLGYTVGAIYKLVEEVSLGLSYESFQDFQDFKFNTDRGTDKMNFDQPQTLTAGVAFKPVKTFRVALDVSWINWPQCTGEGEPVYSENSSGATPWNMNWENQFVYKIGAEYDLNRLLTLRAGYNYGKNPLDQDRLFEGVAFPAIAEHHFTLGAGVRITDALSLNIGAMYAPRITFRAENFAQQFINSAETKMSQYSIDLGLAYKF
jgi:long-chain fatty acid transport protein